MFVRSPIDLWELMSACFNHLRLVLENTDFNTEAIKASHSTGINHKPRDGSYPPGFSILDDMLGEFIEQKFLNACDLMFRRRMS